jgi:hypothetical protein
LPLDRKPTTKVLRHVRRHKRRGGMIAQRADHAPEDAAPADGTYEQLNIFGRPTGIRVNVVHGRGEIAFCQGRSLVIGPSTKKNP